MRFEINIQDGERRIGAANSGLSFQSAQARVGPDCTPLSLVVYIDGSFIKQGIPIKPIYLASANNDREVASKSFAWRLLGVLPTLKKEAAIKETDEWRTERRARLYHACIGELVLYYYVLVIP